MDNGLWTADECADTLIHTMNLNRLKGPASGIRAFCGRCSFIRIITGKGEELQLTLDEENQIDKGEAEVWKSNSPPGGGDMCPRCVGDSWRYVKRDLSSEK